MRNRPQPSAWRPSTVDDDATIVEMCLALNAEDPGIERPSAAQVQGTLDVLRDEPWRGRAVVADIDGGIAGYALLIAFWSNELGGEVCTVDELYVKPDHRGRGIGTELFRELLHGACLAPRQAVAVELEVSPGNGRAREWYLRLGFSGTNRSLVARRTC
jgi:GNAT superfamily N-acetyltransferase